MKFIFAFFVLLHAHQLHVQCRFSDFSENATNAIINKLHMLKAHAQINSTLSELHVPSHEMQTNHECCVSTFKEVMSEALKSVTVPVDLENYLDGINDSLDMLQPPANTTKVCDVEVMCTTKPVTSDPFKEHIKFLQKMNRRRRRTTMKL